MYFIPKICENMPYICEKKTNFLFLGEKNIKYSAYYLIWYHKFLPHF